MLKIRLHRTGKTRRPHFRVVVVEHRQAAQGPYIRSLGFWDPLKHKLTLNKEELSTWLARGARPTDRISRLLKKEGMKHKLITIHERPARGPKEKVEKPEETKPAVAVEEGKPSEMVAEAAQTDAKAETAKESQSTDKVGTPPKVKLEEVESAAEVSKSEKKGK